MLDQYLSKIRVLELSSVLAGPATAMFFAELGARVTKYENKNGGDVTRSWKLPSENPASPISAYFCSVNYKKEYISIDLNNALEKENLLRELSSCDVFIVNFKPGDEIKFGLSYEVINKINPTIIYAHLTGYEKGNNKTAYDVVLQAETGFLSMNGNSESGPVKMPVAMIDLLAAHQLKEGILLALLKKQLENKGSYVHVSLYETAVSSLANQASNYLMEGYVPKRMGTLHPNIAPYGEIIVSSDGIEFILAVGSDQQFLNLCEILNPEIDLKNFATNSARVNNRLELHKTLLTAAKKIPAVDLEQKMLQKNVPHGRINSLKEVFENPAAKKLIREENIHSVPTKRVSGIAFNTDFIHD